MSRPRLFPGVVVSSSFVDFREHRQALIAAINGQALHPIAMEHDAALPSGTVVDSSLQKVRDAAAYVGITGVRYGQVPESPELNPDRVSLTELEFREARQLGIPILLFVMGEDHPVKARDVEVDPEMRRKLDAFREDAKRATDDSSLHRVYAVFNSLQDFEVKATQSVAELRLHLDTGTPVVVVAEPADDEVPTPPALYAEPRYIGSHTFVGRAAQLTTLSDWATSADPHPLLLFEAIGGAGKSMLTWEWITRHAADVHPRWAGQFWYSFYEKGATLADFCQRALAYMMGRPLREFENRRQPELTDLLLRQLQARRWLLVLDGLERILVAYHRFDAAQLRDERAGLTDEIGNRDPSAAVHPLDDELLRRLAGAAPSKILVTSRLLPQILLNPSNQPIPGVRHERLPGLRPNDAEALIRTCGVRGESQIIQDYLHRHCDCHPLVIGAVAGLVNSYLPARGDFDAWVDDPSAGGQLNLGTLDLVQKRNHILTAAVEALPPASQRLLQALSFLNESFDYDILVDLNPELPLPELLLAPIDPYVARPDGRRTDAAEYAARQAAEREAWRAKHREPEVLSRLSQSVHSLERSGLLQYDRSARVYDLHPVVRAVVSAELGDGPRSELGQQVVDLFTARSSDYRAATTLDDLHDGLTVTRTLLSMGRFQAAYEILVSEGLNEVLHGKFEAYAEIVALCRPVFTVSWSRQPDDLSVVESSILASRASAALRALGEFRSAIEVDSLALKIGAVHANHLIAIDFLNLTRSFLATNQICLAARASALSERVAVNVIGRYAGLEARFLVQTTLGHWPDAESIWAEFANRAEDDPVDVVDEFMYLESLIRPLGRLTEAHFAALETRIGGSSRHVVRRLHAARGEWLVSRGEDERAVEPLQDAIHMARAVGLTDATSETLLALARFRLGELPDAAAEADQLGRWRTPDHIMLAELWAVIGENGRATQHAMKAHRWASADGEPFIRRYELTRSEQVLRKIGAKVPVWSPFDSKRYPMQPWERYVAQDDAESYEL